MNKDVEVTFTLPGEFLDRVVERCNENKNVPVKDIINDELDLLSNHCCETCSQYSDDVIGDAVEKAVLIAITDQIYGNDSDEN